MVRHPIEVITRGGLRVALVMAALFAAFLASGCAPDVRPPFFVPRENVPLAGLPTGVAGWPEPSWWLQYNDPQLNRLIDLGMRGSPDLQVAEARYRTATSAVATQRAQLNPQIKGLVDAAHGYSDVSVQGQPPGGQGSTQGLELMPGSSWSNTGVAGAMATWDLDLWGKQKAAVAAAVGQVRAAEADRATAQNSLQYNLASAYFDWLATQARLVVAHQAVRKASDYHGLVALRVHAGLDDPQMLDSADSQWAQQLQSVAMLEGSASLDVAQMAALAGTSMQELGKLSPRPLPKIDARLPADARLGLIARRPDIVSSRWLIEASIRSIDQARAAYYPDVSLMALGGFLTAYPDLGSGMRTNLTLGNIGPSISLPLFSGGRLKAQFESSQAQLDTSVANYNRTVVQAAQDVARQILTLQQLANTSQQQNRQLADSASQVRRADHRRYEGIEDDRTYLSAGLSLDQQRDAQLQLQGQQLATELALIHALGGGYHAEHVPTLPKAIAKDDPR